MKFCRLVLASLLICAALGCGSGCADYRELEEILVVRAAAVDYENSDEMTLTAEILRAAGASAGESNGTSTYTVRAATMAGCEHELQRIAGGELYWGHANVILFAKNAAERYLDTMLDWALRDNETRLTVVFAVSNEPTAAEIFSGDPKEPSAAESMDDIFDSGDYAGARQKAAAVHVRNKLDGSQYAILPVVGVSQSADYRSESGGGGPGDDSGGKEKFSLDSSPDGGGSDESQPGKSKSNESKSDESGSGGAQSVSEEAAPNTEPRLTAEGAVIVIGNPARIAATLTDDEARLLSLADGECGRSGYIVDGSRWSLVVENVTARRHGGLLKIDGKCRIADLDDPSDVDPEDYEKIADEAARILENRLAAMLAKVADAVDGDPPSVAVTLSVVNIGLISGR